MPSRVPLLVYCRNHGLAPWALVCVHLVEGTSGDWRPVQVNDGREVESDWVCPSCEADLNAARVRPSSVRCICINCLRGLLERAGVRQPQE